LASSIESPAIWASLPDKSSLILFISNFLFSISSVFSCNSFCLFSISSNFFSNLSSFSRIFSSIFSSLCFLCSISFFSSFHFLFSSSKSDFIFTISSNCDFFSSSRFDLILAISSSCHFLKPSCFLLTKRYTKIPEIAPQAIRDNIIFNMFLNLF